MTHSERFQYLQGQAPRNAKTPDDPVFVGWKRDCEAAIKKVYGPTSSEFVDFRNLRFDWRGYVTATHGPGAPTLFQNAIAQALALLTSFQTEQRQEEQDAALKAAEPTERPSIHPDRKKVFVVHGHDEALKVGVARLIERLKLEPVILHETPDQAKTIIEKLETNSNVGFAVVLLTGDDQGSRQGVPGQMKSRARQNVVFEFGYFVGLLGRNRVMALKEDGFEAFSDYDGVLHTKVDAAGAWQLKLAVELKAAGYAVDLNHLYL